MIRCALLLAVVAAGTVAGVRADDWPEFRGPTGQGTAQGDPPVTWGEAKNVAWKQALPGKGWSSPVVHAGRVYLTTSVPGPDAGGSLRGLCLDAGTGKTLWDVEVFREAAAAPRIHAKNSPASPTPLVHGGRLYVHFGHQGTACLDLAGRVVWRNTELTYPPVHGNGGSPVLAGGALIFSTDGADRRRVVALDADTGKVRWQTDRTGNAPKNFSFSTPLLITVGGQPQVISPGSNMVGAYDPRTGQEIWWVRYDGYSVVPRPVFGHGLLFVLTGFDAPRLLAIRPDGKGDVTDTHVAWSTRKNVPLTPSPLLVGDELYLISDGGTASCLDARTGQVHWQERVGGRYSASPVYAAGRVYCQSEEGVGVVLKAGKQFELLAKNPLNERTLASYAVADGALFIRTEKQLYRIQGRSP